MASSSASDRKQAVPGWALDLLHLTAWGQLGVLVRYFVEQVAGAAWLSMHALY